MMSKMEEIFKRVLNDKDIFWIKKEIFNEAEWNKLKESKDNQNDFIAIVKRKIKSLENERERERNRNKKSEEFEKALELCRRLETALRETPNILEQLLNLLKSYGVIQSNLPAMEDYGKIIERYGISPIEQFFLNKIKRENDKHKKKALAKVLEYVKELYNANISPLEIAYFVRKLDSLIIFWEV